MYRTATQLIIGLSLVIILGSCTKEDFTKPLQVSFFFDIIRDQSPNNFLSFTSGELYLKEFEFEGYRESVQNYFFEKEFDSSYFFSLDTSIINQTLNFDIPQGVYQRISISLAMEQETEDISKSLQEGDDEVMSEEETSFQVSFEYTKLGGGKTNVLFQAGQIEFEITAEDVNGEPVIVLQVEQPSEAIIYFNPTYAFQTLPREFFESAETVIIDNEPTILFSEESNESLYEMILYRFQISAKLVIA